MQNQQHWKNFVDSQSKSALKIYFIDYFSYVKTIKSSALRENSENSPFALDLYQVSV